VAEFGVGVWALRGKSGRGGTKDMNIEIWMMVLAVLLAMAATWMLCRWFYMRRIKDGQRRLSMLDGTYQATVKLQAQARRQVEELQRIVAEYRRRLTAAELARRAPPVLKVMVTEPDNPEPPRKGQVTWADTQPM